MMRKGTVKQFDPNLDLWDDLMFNNTACFADEFKKEGYKN